MKNDWKRFCDGRFKYKDKGSAEDVARELAVKGVQTGEAFKCEKCGEFHVLLRESA